MRHTNPVYLSDLLAVPTPRHTGNRRIYDRKLFFRKMIWSVLPVLGQVLLWTAALTLVTAGFAVLLLGLC